MASHKTGSARRGWKQKKEKQVPQKPKEVKMINKTPSPTDQPKKESANFVSAAGSYLLLTLSGVVRARIGF